MKGKKKHFLHENDDSNPKQHEVKLPYFSFSSSSRGSSTSTRTRYSNHFKSILALHFYKVTLATRFTRQLVDATFAKYRF